MQNGLSKKNLIARAPPSEWGVTQLVVFVGAATVTLAWLAQLSTAIILLLGFCFSLWFISIFIAVQGDIIGLYRAVLAVIYNPRTFLGEGKSWKSSLLLEFLFWRLPTCWFRALPDVYIIGAQKCGTTSLHSYLCEDNEHFSAGVVKETHFIDGRSPVGTLWEKNPVVGRRLLRSFFDFSFRSVGKMVVEGTPESLYCGWMLPALSKLNPHAKYIVLLRDPIDRAYSSYLHQVRKGREKLDFDEAVRREIMLNTDESHPLGKKFLRLYAEAVESRSMAPLLSEPWSRNAFFRLSYLARGRYSPQIKVLLKAIRREQILFIDSSDFFSETMATLTMVRDWLGVHAECKIQIDISPKNSAGSAYNKTMSSHTQNLVENHLSIDWPDIVSKYCTFPPHLERNKVFKKMPPRASNPIVFPSSRGRYIGSNVSGPSVIKTPGWIPAKHSLGKFYMYFAHHKGKGIRLAYADNIEGPWGVAERAVLHINNCPGYDHVASPDVHIDEGRQKIIMYFHSPSTSIPPFRKQSTYCAVSDDGLHFSVVGWDATHIEKSNLSVDKIAAVRRGAILGPFYFRVFRLRDTFYALARDNRNGGIWMRKPGPPQHNIDEPVRWERGNHIFPRMRHCFVVVSQDQLTLKIFFSRVGELPEGVFVTTVDVSSHDWNDWKEVGESKAVYFPKDSWEGGHCHDLFCNVCCNRNHNKTKYGKSQRRKLPLLDIRDPCVLENDGETWLFYAGGGEAGIGVTRLHQEYNMFAHVPHRRPDNLVVSNSKKTAKRFVIYDPGCVGLGHANRCSQIALTLMQHYQMLGEQPADILVISGNGMVWSMFLDEHSKRGGIDCICLPTYQRRIDGYSPPMEETSLPGQSIWSTYYSKSLNIPSPSEKHSGYGLCSLRSRIIKEVVTTFQPDVLLVDFEPLGVHGELIPALKSLCQTNKEGTSTTRIVLGLRDVLDSPEQFKAEWAAKGVLNCLEGFYDEIVVYGEKDIWDPLQGVLPKNAKIKTHYVGYLGEKPQQKQTSNSTIAVADCGEKPGEIQKGLESDKTETEAEQRELAFHTLSKEKKLFKFVKGQYFLVSGGGGIDAGYLYDWVIRSYEDMVFHKNNQNVSLPPLCVIFGLFHPEDLVNQFEARINAVNLCHHVKTGSNLITTYRFLRHLDFESLLINCRGLISMCGANTWSEICKFNVRALCVPRDSFRKEQLIRADVFARCGAIKMLRAEYTTNSVSESAASNPTEKMTEALLALESQKKPSEVLDLAHLTNGLNRVCRILTQPPGDHLDADPNFESSIRAEIGSLLSTIYDPLLPLRRRLEELRNLRSGHKFLAVLQRLSESPPLDLQSYNMNLFVHEALYNLIRANNCTEVMISKATRNLLPLQLLKARLNLLPDQSNKLWLEGFPHFIVIGASKCGTSSLVRYLLRQPSIAFMSRTGGISTVAEDKSTDIGRWDDIETHVFDEEMFSPTLMIHRHLSFVPGEDANIAELLGAYTPHYIFHPLVPYRLASMLPKKARLSMKFVIMLRNPANRALSSVWFKKSTGTEEREIEKVLHRGMEQRRRLEKRIKEELAERFPNASEMADESCLTATVERNLAKYDDLTDGRVRVNVGPDDVSPWETVFHSLFFQNQPAGSELRESNLFLEHIGKGIYHEQLLRWWAIFPRKNFFVFSLEEFEKNSVEIMVDLLKFLHLSGTNSYNTEKIGEILSERYNVTSSVEKARSPASSQLCKELEAFYLPYNAELFNLVGRKLW